MLTELIEALQIFAKYGNPDYPTHCEHDILIICGIEPEDVSKKDKEKLDDLGFIVSTPFDNSECFISYKYGSA